MKERHRRFRLTMSRSLSAALSLSIFAIACGTAESTQEAGDGAAGENAQSERFPANREIGPMRLHVPEHWDEYAVEDSGQGEIITYSDGKDGPDRRYVVSRTDFQGARSIAAAHGILSAEVQFDGGTFDAPEVVVVEGADIAWASDVTWPGVDGEVTARYWIARDDETGVMAAVEYGGYGAESEELDEYGQTLELVPEMSR